MQIYSGGRVSMKDTIGIRFRSTPNIQHKETVISSNVGIMLTLTFTLQGIPYLFAT